MDESELAINKQEIVALTQDKGLEQVIKPLIKEIYLFDTYVAGVSYLKDKSVFQEISIGDKLILQRENNKFDERAILIMTKDGKKLGYIPEKDNIIFSRLMDAGKMLSANITEIKKKTIDYHQISISIYLVDF
jgi:hypothetical protein